MSVSLRPLGKTGALVEAVSLGGEGILRTTGRDREAVPMIQALRLGVRYCDTAPAYSGSQDYYGAAFREAGKEARDKVFLASKTHVRDRDGALRLLDDSLKRIGTDRLDLWQLHDLRDAEDLDAIFGKGGAIEAVEKAKSEGRVRFVGITGHHDPAILVEAMRRYPVDTVLCAMNPEHPRRLPFLFFDGRPRGEEARHRHHRHEDHGPRPPPRGPRRDGAGAGPLCVELRGHIDRGVFLDRRGPPEPERRPRAGRPDDGRRAHSPRVPHRTAGRAVDYFKA